MSAPREREEVMRAYDIMEAIETKAKFLAELYSVDSNELGKISGAGFVYGNNSNIMQNTIRNTEHEVYNLQMSLYENKAVQTNNKLMGTIGYALYSGALFDKDGVSGLEGQLRSNTKYDQIIDAEVTKRNLKDDKEILSIGLSFTPGVLAMKGGIDLYQGKDFITGRKMSLLDKGFTIAGMVLPAAAKLKGLKVAKGIAGAADDVARGGDELIQVYRGTDNFMEQQVFNETGHLLSDSARNAYLEGAALEDAYKASEPIHNEWLKIWGIQNNYVQAHGEFGTELSKAFKMDRTLMSVTTDPAIAKSFATRTGTVYKALIPKSQLIQQTIKGAGESEYLVKFGSGGFTPCK